jgi:hypothetical protein
MKEEIKKAINEIKDAQELGSIANHAMARACLLENSLELDSEGEFRSEGSLFLKTSMHFEMELVEKEGGDE